MNKAIVGVAAIGAVIALRPVIKRRLIHKMSEHCQQMAGKCKRMMAGAPAERGEPAGMPEHPEREPKFVGREVVGTA